MRLNKKNKKKLIIAVVLGGVAAVSILNSMNSRNAVIDSQNKKLNELNSVITDLKQNPFKEEKPEEKKVSVVVATQDVKYGDTFTAEMLKTEEYKEDALPEEPFKTTALLIGKKAGKNIVAGQFVTSSDIQAEDINTIEIPNDTRAISIPVDKFKGLASHIRVGTSVDILKVSNPPEFIAQNLRIIALETRDSAAAASRYNANANRVNTQYLTATQASSITFLVPVDIVSKLVDAMFQGQLQLIARNNNDEKIVISDNDLPPPPLNSSETELPEFPDEEEFMDPEMPDPDPKKIQIIQASRISTEDFIEETSLSAENGSDNKKPIDPELKELIDLVE